MPPNMGGMPNNSQNSTANQQQGQGGQDGQGPGPGNQGGQNNQGNQGQGNQGGQDGQNQGQGQGQTFDTWYANLSGDVKGLIDGHVTGLKSALDSERAERKSLAKQIGDLKGKAEKGSELETQLGQLTAQLETLGTKTTFYETAPGDLSNPRLAYLAASEGGHINAKTGTVDWAALRTSYPELFRRQAPPPPANGGQGRNQNGAAEPNMNLFIRRAAGRN